MPPKRPLESMGMCVDEARKQDAAGKPMHTFRVAARWTHAYNATIVDLDCKARAQTRFGPYMVWLEDEHFSLSRCYFVVLEARCRRIEPPARGPQVA
jgi:hypothetical protein